MVKMICRKLRFSVLIVVALILSVSGLLGQNKTGEKIKLRRSAANVLTDGKIETAEWSGGSEFPMAGGGKIFFRYDGEFLHVGLRGPEKGWCHLYLTDGAGKDIKILHASAALGAVVYRRSATNFWQPENLFEWDFRTNVFDEETKQKLGKYLAENGWKANNNNLGSGRDIEFSIKIEKEKRKKYRLAAVFTSDGKNRQFFPAALTGSALDPELIYGRTPRDLDFKIKSWATVVFK